MDSALDESQQMLLETTRRFIESGSPIARARVATRAPHTFDADRWKEVTKLGWLEIGASLLHEDTAEASVALQNAAIVAGELGRYVQGEPFVSSVLAVAAITRSASKEMSSTLLTALLAGEGLAVWCCPNGLTSRVQNDNQLQAVRKNGVWELTGVATMVEEGAGARYFVVSAHDEGPTWVQCVVDAQSSGVVIEPLESLDITRHFANVHVDGVRVSDDFVLQSEDPLGSVQHQIAVATMLQCAETVGAADRVLSFTLEYLPNRSTFGRSIASYQAIKHRLADCYFELESSRAVTEAAERAVATEPDSVSASVAKSHVSPSCTHVVEECLQFHGGIGFTWEHDIHLYLRRVRTNAPIFGSPSWHRQVVARMLGLNVTNVTALEEPHSATTASAGSLG